MQPSSPPPPSAFRVHTYVYVARANVTVLRRFFQCHMIQDEHISCGYVDAMTSHFSSSSNVTWYKMISCGFADAMTSHFSSRLTIIPACREVRLRHIHVKSFANVVVVCQGTKLTILYLTWTMDPYMLKATVILHCFFFLQHVFLCDSCHHSTLKHFHIIVPVQPWLGGTAEVGNLWSTII